MSQRLATIVRSVSAMSHADQVRVYEYMSMIEYAPVATHTRSISYMLDAETVTRNVVEGIENIIDTGDES